MKWGIMEYAQKIVNTVMKIIYVKNVEMIMV